MKVGALWWRRRCRENHRPGQRLQKLLANPSSVESKPKGKTMTGGLFDMGPDRDHPAYHAGYELITTEEQLHAFVK